MNEMTEHVNSVASLFSRELLIAGSIVFAGAFIGIGLLSIGTALDRWVTFISEDKVTYLTGREDLE